jgi:hypothetical protein
LKQRKTQTAEYWQKQFKVSAQDLEAIYQQILDQNTPISLDEISLSIVKRHYEAEEMVARTELQQGRLYLPRETYVVGDTIIFPAMDDLASGTVIATRPGYHPDYGEFTVITVEFKGGVKDFASAFNHEHPLNLSEQSLASMQGLISVDELYQMYRPDICAKIKNALDNSSDFVAFQDKYFLKDGLPEFHEGLFNIADAAIDINQGPLSTVALIEQMGLAEPGQEIPEVLRFGLNYRLANDERFDDVGPTGQILWYLDRIEPPEAHFPPLRLRANKQNYDPSLFNDDLYELLADIDDEMTMDEDAAPADPDAKRATIVLNYPHWRVGTLPLTPKLRSFFPASQYNPVLFEFIDGRTGNSFPGWTVAKHKYVFGLEKWYKKNNLPVGAYITLKRTDDPMKIIVEFKTTRAQRDWVRMVKVTNHKLSFQMNPAPIACTYDDLMIVNDTTPAAIDKLWVNAEERHMPLFDLLCDIFPELSKLNPQSTVHAKTLYSAVNVIQRAAPGVIFQELGSHRCFVHIDHGYWTFDKSLKD